MNFFVLLATDCTNLEKGKFYEESERKYVQLINLETMKVCWTEEGNYFEGEVIDSYPVEDGTMLVVEAENGRNRFVLREWNTLIGIGEDGNAIE